MHLSEIIETKVLFKVSEPWDFLEKVGEGPFFAIIKGAREDAILISLSTPLTYGGISFSQLVATHRYASMISVDDLIDGKVVIVNLTPVDLAFSANAKSIESSFDFANGWRSWHLIGGLRRS